MKWFEAVQTGLPMCILGALFGPIRLRAQYVFWGWKETQKVWGSRKWVKACRCLVPPQEAKARRMRQKRKLRQ